jgi:hypothetical protein
VMDAARNVGAFNVRVMRRKGLARGTERALRTLIKVGGIGANAETEDAEVMGLGGGAAAVEVEPESAVAGGGVSSNEEALAKELRRVLKAEVFSDAKDVVKKVPARCLRIPRDSPFMHPTLVGGGAFLAGGDKSHRSLKRRLWLLEHGQRNKTADAAKSRTLSPEEAVLVDSRTGRTLDHAQQLFRYLVLRGLDKKRHREGQQRAGGGDRIIETPRKPRTVADVEVEEDRDGNKLKASAEASAPKMAVQAPTIDHRALIVGVKVEVRLRNWGKWYSAVVDGVTMASLVRQSRFDELDAQEEEEAYGSDLGSDEEQVREDGKGASFISTTAAADGKENATKAAKVATKKGKKGTKKGPKKIKSKMEDARAAANKACAKSVEALFESDGKLIPPPPAFYNVRLAKASRPGRLEEAVEAVLRKCSKAGEKVEEEVDDKGRPTVRLREFSISDSHSFLILPLFSLVITHYR